MDTEDLHPLLSDLETQIDTLETTLNSLLKTPLTTLTAKLPLLDQAKLQVLTVYAIESLLFSALRLNGVDAKEHAVFQELARVKEYFGKIKAAENGGVGGNAKRGAVLDKEAAGRFVKAGLAGNERYDAQRAERSERERAGAKRKLEEMDARGTHTKLDDGEEGEGSSMQENGGFEPKTKKKRSKKEAKKAVNRFGGYADLKREDGDQNESKDDESDSGGEGDGGVNVEEGSQGQRKRGHGKGPKSSKQALESLLEGGTEREKSKKRRNRRKKDQRSSGDQTAQE